MSPSTLNVAGQSGEIVMITDPAFASALAPLVGLRQSQGYTVKVVDVQDIYDEFSFGQKTPDGHSRLPRPRRGFVGQAAAIRSPRRERDERSAQLSGAQRAGLRADADRRDRRPRNGVRRLVRGRRRRQLRRARSRSAASRRVRRPT